MLLPQGAGLLAMAFIAKWLNHSNMKSVVLVGFLILADTVVSAVDSLLDESVSSRSLLVPYYLVAYYSHIPSHLTTHLTMSIFNNKYQ
jgi:secreted trypsin-like serine protease